jgi:hypothetical protein
MNDLLLNILAQNVPEWYIGGAFRFDWVSGLSTSEFIALPLRFAAPRGA